MFMYGNTCTAIVPYVPIKAKRSFFGSLFDTRSRLYAFSFCFCVAVLFASYSFCGRFGLRLSTILTDNFPAFYSHIKFVLFLYIAGFTVFSPVAYLISLLAYSFYTGVLLYELRLFLPRLSAAVFLFLSLLYFCEICLCYNKTKYGIRQIFSPRRVVYLSFLTLVYIFMSFLYFGLYFF